jgi:hypothetical protein
VQSLGLAAEYKNLESDVGNWIKYFFSLSYDQYSIQQDVETYCDKFPLFYPEEEKTHAAHTLPIFECMYCIKLVKIFGTILECSVEESAEPWFGC